MEFFTDAYDLFYISLVTKLLGRIYYTDITKPKPGVLPPNIVFHAGFGILAGGIVALIVSSAYDHKYDLPSYHDDPIGSIVHSLDYVWHIILMFAVVPAALTYYWRMKMPETTRYTALVAKNAKQAASDMSKVLQVDLDAEEDKLQIWLRKKAKGSTGKAGAIVTAFGLLYVVQSKDPKKVDSSYPTGIGVKNSLIMLGVINFFGMLFTLLVPESKGKSLEELSGTGTARPVVGRSPSVRKTNTFHARVRTGMAENG